MSEQPQHPDKQLRHSISLGTFEVRGTGEFSGGVVKLWNDPAKDLLEAATNFLSAADRCLNGNRIESGVTILTVPGAVCAAFSCELYLKYIVFMETGKHIRGHKLELLFKECSDRSQQSLIERRNDIFEVIQRNSDHFVKARYAHEEDIFSFRQQELLQIAETLSGYVKDHFEGKAST